MVESVLHTTELTNWAVDLIGVHKTYGRKIQALRGVNIQVGRGEIFGLLGPNGAGKSTLVRIMMTLIHPDEAKGTILGRPLGNRKKRAVMGFLPELTRFPPYLTGLQVLDYYGALAHVPKSKRRTRANELLERVGIAEWRNTRASQYSKGMQRRLGIAQALINAPELVVLDEPTDGLDPMGRRDVRTLLTELKAKGTTVFVNSHLLGEVEMVCDRVAILNKGLVARQGRLDELTEHTNEYHITVSGDVSAIRAEVEAMRGRVADGSIVIDGHDAKRLNEVIDMLREKNIMVESITPHRFSLEDVFVQIIGDAGAAGSNQSASDAQGK